ncbi:hypothetical protein BGX27_010881 [Mortierella sp. AM989]|nr:hypothetical protein BGX27_010881 [Mortierella sp. AM989]
MVACRHLCLSNIIKGTATSAAAVELNTDEQSQKPKTPTVEPKSSSKYGSWTPEMDKLLGQLRSENRTWEYISIALGRPVSACSDRYYITVDPVLKTWTPAMFLKLDQMVDDGVKWPSIAAALNQRVITCQHQWRTLGKGRFRVKGFLTASQFMHWGQHEIESFWTAWLEFGKMNWVALAKHMGTRSEEECRESFRSLIVHTLKDAPGWAKLEAFNYATETSRKARSRMLVMAKYISPTINASKQDKSEWTAEEHTALLEAVERYGLFSDWAVIREQVKPNLDDDEVEAEYYRLNGVTIKTDPNRQLERPVQVVIKQHDGWTEAEIQRLNTILMKYSSLPIWVREAAKHGVEPSDDDYDMLFKKSKRSSIGLDSDKAAGPKLSEPRRRKKQPELPWSTIRISRLKRLVYQQQQQERATGHPINWSWVADHIGPGIDANMCITMWQNMPEYSRLQYGPAKYWSDEENDLLQQGIAAHGKSWTLIHRNFLKHRSMDSVRRKVTNLLLKRADFAASQRSIALDLKVSYPDLDVDAFVRNAIERDQDCSLAERLGDLMQKYAESNGRERDSTKKQKTARKT